MTNSPRWRAAALAVVALGAAGLTAVATPAGAAVSCAATYRVTGAWQGGFQGALTVRNTGDALTSWTIAFTMPTGQSVTQGWGGVWTTGAAPRITNASYNGSVATGGSIELGFIGSGNNAAGTTGTGFTLNGVACGGGGGGGGVTTTTRAGTTTTTTRTSGGTASNGYPYCVNGSASDPDGDGWGWENNASCVVRGSSADPDRGTSSTTSTSTSTRTTTTTTTSSGSGGGSTSCGVNTVDPDATAAAKRLLCYIYSQYGNHIISGQQESTWVSGPDYEMNYIRTISGKYPAIRGQDMGDAPDFGARGLAWWNAGGIPMVGYHMGSPSQSTDGYNGSRMSGNINAALTAGTADNTRLNQRLTGWANQLKIIQNGGGAVLFRPWHEAGGTWFWWSMEGSSLYNRLWVYTYNYMRAQGVHNLVYLHPFNGSPNSAWYPGKQYVDIGGADTYAGNNGPLTSMFNSCKNIYGSTMPIALHENGPIPDPAQLQSTATRWVLFNTWHTSWITDTSKNPTSSISSYYNSSYVVTRDEVPNLR